MKTLTIGLIAAALGLLGCASSGLVERDGATAISPRTAQQAAQMHDQIVAEFGGEVAGARGAYVDEIGRKVAAQSGIQGGGAGAFNFTIVNSPVPNAFAVPGGGIFITRQLLGLMDNEAELASVLGHEIGHITEDHSKERQDRGLLGQLGVLVTGILTGSGDLAQIAGLVSQGLFAQYSQGQEYEADEVGISFMSRAGYDADAAATLLASLGAVETLDRRIAGQDQRAVPSWARTHPNSRDRVERADALAGRVQPAGAGIINRDRYLQMIDGMIWDDDPAQGVIEDRTFLHPDLRIRFTVPPGYAINNGVRAVTIAGSGGQAQFSGGRYGGSLDSYIAQVFRQLTGGRQQVRYPPPRRTTVNGIPAAYTTAQVRSQSGVVDVSVIAYQWDGDTAYHFVTVARAGSQFGPFGSMVQSVGKLSASQAAAVRPRVIDIVTVRSGDTPQSLAERMAYRTHKLERFLTLNSLGPDSRLQPGDKVKLVVYGSR
ncbi:MAG: M48 family metalloprotease [Sphingomonadaceae bacterium]